jgi:glycosyltransferase involved in cell wall biosynthesis
MNQATNTPAATAAPPILSICVPTYKRAHLLRMMLRAVLPQIRESNGAAELWVCDNASPDETAQVVEAARALGPVSYARNARNLGFHGNIVRLASELARGDYVWVLGDDDLVTPGSVRRLIDTLRANQMMDSFYLNYGIARYPDDWPEAAVGGYTGTVRRLHVDTRQDRRVPQWKEFLHPDRDLGTAMFACITRRTIWVNYWKEHSVDPPTAKTTTAVFPHSVMWAQTIMERPSYFVGEPASICFYGSQSWSADPSFVHSYTHLLRVYQRHGLAGAHLKECERGVFTHIECPLTRLLRDPTNSPSKTIAAYLVSGWRCGIAWRVLTRAIRCADRPWLISKSLGAIGKLNRHILLFDPWKPIAGAQRQQLGGNNPVDA